MNIFYKSILSIRSISKGCVQNLIAPLSVITALAIAACVPSTPVQHFASENAISLKYSAYDSVPTLTAEALDMAAQHCKKYGKHANYKGGNAANSFSTEEIHRFACDDKKTDDSEVIRCSISTSGTSGSTKLSSSYTNKLHHRRWLHELPFLLKTECFFRLSDDFWRAFCIA